ncbi:MAG: TolC family protein, partial [Deltaproteobacteria bacterium]|nr:TolC family protein [Deltaproteobacteria bacterium]
MTPLLAGLLWVAAAEAQPLTLEQAIDLALRESADLEAALIAIESAALSPGRLDASFAWTAWAEAGVNRDAAPRTTEFQPQTMTTVPASVGVRRLFPFGTSLEAQLAGSYFDAPFPDLGIPIPVIERGFTQSFTLSATHPLWGSAAHELVDLQRREVTSDVQAGVARTADTLDQVLGEVHRRFWTWALAKQSLRTADAAVAAAHALREQTERKSRRGLAETRDLLRAQAALEVALDQRLAVERTLDAARRALLDRIGTPDRFTDATYQLDRAVPALPVSEIVARAEATSLALR